MPLIDEKGTKAILGWLNDGKKVIKYVSILNDTNPLDLKVDSDEIRILEFILKKNNIKYTISDLNNVSKN